MSEPRKHCSGKYDPHCGDCADERIATEIAARHGLAFDGWVKVDPWPVLAQFSIATLAGIGAVSRAGYCGDYIRMPSPLLEAFDFKLTHPEDAPVVLEVWKHGTPPERRGQPWRPA